MLLQRPWRVHGSLTPSYAVAGGLSRNRAPNEARAGVRSPRPRTLSPANASLPRRGRGRASSRPVPRWSQPRRTVLGGQNSQRPENRRPKLRRMAAQFAADRAAADETVKDGAATKQASALGGASLCGPRLCSPGPRRPKPRRCKLRRPQPTKTRWMTPRPAAIITIGDSLTGPRWRHLAICAISSST